MLISAPEYLSWVINAKSTNTVAVKVLNLSKDPVSFRVVATQSRRYKVNPTSGTLEGKGSISDSQILEITLVDAPVVINQFKAEGRLEDDRLLIFSQRVVEIQSNSRWPHETTKVTLRLSFPGVMPSFRVLLASEEIDRRIDSLRQTIETAVSRRPHATSGPEQDEVATLQRKYTELASQALSLAGERERLLLELTGLEKSVAVAIANLAEPEFEPQTGASAPQLILAGVVAFFLGSLLPLRAGLV